MEPNVQGAGSTSLSAPGVVDPTHPQFPAAAPAASPSQEHLALPVSPPPAPSAPANPAGGTALIVAKIIFVLLLLITAAVLAALGMAVGAIVALFGGVGMTAIELLKRL